MGQKQTTRRRHSQEEPESSQSSADPISLGLASFFTYEELKLATNNFHSSKELGSGGYDKVYLGTLRGQTVAVKKLYDDENLVEQFINEVAILSRIRHKNMVNLLGFTNPRNQETIKTQVGNMLEVPILDPTKAKPVGILHVKVVRGLKLKKKDRMGKSHPYVNLKLTEDKLLSKKTEVKHTFFNPEWNEEFTFVVRDPQTQTLEFNVYDWEQVGKHEKIGMNVIPLKDLTPDETKYLTLELLKNMDPSDVQNEKSRGQLVVEVTLQGKSGLCHY